MLHAMMPSNVRVLDVGCGGGSVTVIVNHQRGNEVVAIEPNPIRADLAVSRGVAVHRGQLDQAFADGNGRFDVVMFADVLEHLPAPVEQLDLAISMLKPGGLVLASSPNVAHWSVRLNLLVGRFDYAPSGIMDATHLRWFTAKTFRALFESRGLEVVEMRQTIGIELPTYSRGACRLIPRRHLRGIVRRLNAAFPLLFGCQHVVKARKIRTPDCASSAALIHASVGSPR